MCELAIEARQRGVDATEYLVKVSFACVFVMNLIIVNALRIVLDLSFSLISPFIVYHLVSFCDINSYSL